MKGSFFFEKLPVNLQPLSKHQEWTDGIQTILTQLGLNNNASVVIILVQ